jgi:hypothetical protein
MAVVAIVLVSADWRQGLATAKTLTASRRPFHVWMLVVVAGDLLVLIAVRLCSHSTVGAGHRPLFLVHCGSLESHPPTLPLDNGQLLRESVVSVQSFPKRCYSA